MRAIQVVIADDNQDSIEIVKYFINQSSHFEVIGTCPDGRSLVEEVAAKRPDLVFVDINMPYLNGMDSIKECMKFKEDLKFIFITGYDEFAIEAFDLSALDYIVKPIERTRLSIALERAKQSIKLPNRNEKMPETQKKRIKRLPLTYNGSIEYVPVQDVILIEQSSSGCTIHTEGKVYEIGEKLTELYQYLDPEIFLQTDSSCIANLQKVSHIGAEDETHFVYFSAIKQRAYISKANMTMVEEKLRDVGKTS